VAIEFLIATSPHSVEVIVAPQPSKRKLPKARNASRILFWQGHQRYELRSKHIDGHETAELLN
jgi:hypothetical protein